MWVSGDSLAFLLLLTLTYAFAVPVDSDCPSKGGYDDDRQQQRCKLYLAESSIPNAGLGIYVKDGIGENETLSHFQDVVLPILDIELHNDYNAIEWLLSDYSWTASKLGVELEAKRVTALAPGLGAMANNHHALANIAFKGTPSNDEAGLRRGSSPGAGTITPYHRLEHYATKSIEAGSELFHDYGVRWGEKRANKLGPIPLKEHYDEADRIITCFEQFLRNTSISIHDKNAEDIWGTMRYYRQTTEKAASNFDHVEQNIAKPLQQMMLDNSCVIADVTGRTTAALSFPFHSIRNAMRFGSAWVSLPNLIRSPSWLERNGRCVDGVTVGSSSIQDAGRGAIATRSFVSGEIVTTTPLLQLNRSLLDTYQFSMGHPGKQRKLSSSKLGRQLILNYCYAHRGSSLVLFPYAPAVNAINHGKRANIRIKWSSFSWQQNDWLNLSVGELLDRDKTGLLFDIVATKTIVAGEEILLDYGEEWQDEWQKYSSAWTSFFAAVRGKEYIPASEANVLNIPFTEEKSNLETWCHIGSLKKATKPVAAKTIVKMDLENFQDIVVEGWIERQWTSRHDNRTDPRTNNWRACKVISREMEVPGKETYTVGIKKMGVDPSGWIVVIGLPSKLLSYRNLPYTADIHLTRAFRSPIRIPDDMFPSKWQDLTT